MRTHLFAAGSHNVAALPKAEIINSAAWTEASDLGEWKPKIRPQPTNRQHSVFRQIA